MKKLLFVQALSPLHAGTGQSTGAIDLPIARDKATGIPLLPGSSLKGSLRTIPASWINSWIKEYIKNKRDNKENVLKELLKPQPDKRNNEEIRKVIQKFDNPEHAKTSSFDEAAQLAKFIQNLFGAEDSLNAGDLVIGDANLVFLPVRSIAGTFAYVTSPWILSKLNRDWKEVMGNNNALKNTPTISETGDCFISAESVLKVEVNGQQKVVFEDLDLTPKQDNLGANLVNDLASGLPADYQGMFKERVCVVHDDVMSFLCQHAMDVRTRVSIDHDTGTVEKGALWTEESLPTESILCSMVMTRTNNNEAADLLNQLASQSIQLGGKATVGRGRCKLILKGEQ